MVPLAVEESPPSVLEEQSPTLIIEGVPGEVASEMEAVKVRGNGEEEGSSSTPGKDTMWAMTLMMEIKL